MRSTAPDYDVLIKADPDRINQVVDILISNAIRHASRPGVVELSIEPTNDDVCIHVRDDGTGISKTESKHLFQRFYRARDARSTDSQGTALGLVIAQYLVQAHGGTISVVSDPGAGTTFTVELPAQGPGISGQ